MDAERLTHYLYGETILSHRRRFVSGRSYCGLLITDPQDEAHGSDATCEACRRRDEQEYAAIWELEHHGGEQ